LEVVYSSPNLTEDSPTYSAIKPLTPGMEEKQRTFSGFALTDFVENSKYLIDYELLQIEETIGEGNQGTVLKGQYHGARVAIKKLTITDKEHTKIILSEALIMQKIPNHPNIVSFIGLSLSPVCIVTEFMENGSLNSFFKPETKLDTIGILAGIAAGMQHLSAHKLVHKDLAARNILLNKNMDPKVADFGYSKIRNTESEYSTSKLGPLRWMAPEALYKQKFSEYSDVWSFGIVCLEVLNKTKPYPDVLSLQDFALKFGAGLRPHKYIPDCPLKSLIEECFREVPTERPNFAKIRAEIALLRTETKAESKV